MKKLLTLILAIVMIASLGAAAFAQPVIVKADQVENADPQIQVLFDSLKELVPQNDGHDWFVAVTDLDRNGKLELIASCVSGQEHKSLVKIYELSADMNQIVELTTDAEEDGSFMDILSDSADTFHDTKTDTYYYMFSDGTFLNQNEYNSVKCSVSLKDGKLTHREYAFEHSENYNGITVIEYTNLNGETITPDEFNSAGSNEFAGFEKYGTNFGWVEYKAIDRVSQLADSYAIFIAEKEPQKQIVVPEATPQIVNPGFLMITKNPTSEYKTEGQTAWFVAYADNWNSLIWTFVSPDGGQYSAQNFMNIFPYCGVSGVSGTSLSISNVSLDMNGWGAFCTFYGNNQTARSNTAYINVSSKPQPTPKPTSQPIIGGMMGGYVSDYLMSTVTIQLDNGDSVQVLKDICYVTVGDLDYGCPCTVYFNGGYPSRDNITSVTIQGKVYSPPPVAITQSMQDAIDNGTYDEDTNYLDDLEIPEGWND